MRELIARVRKALAAYYRSLGLYEDAAWIEGGEK